MSQAAKAQEPSMEEILASIRRIIADDDANKTARPPEPAAPPPAAARPTAVPPPPVAPAAPPRPAMSQTDIDAVLAGEDKAKTPPAAPTADILELTEAQAAPPPKKPEPAPNFRTIDGQSDVIFSDRPPEAAPEPAPRAMEEARRQFTQFSDRSLLSNTTAAAVDSAFNSLAHTVLGQNARTLEDLVKEMLRPMLKAWLDDNLPGLVDRIVRAEIERVSRGRG
jgi:cell pole-organizing protein PopZ